MGVSLSDALGAGLRPWIYPVASWGAFVLILVSSRNGRRRLLAERPEALLWAAVLSVFLSFGVDRFNSFAPVWTHLGLPFGEPWRTVAQGLSFAAALPTILAASFLCGLDESLQGSSPRYALPLRAGLLLAAALGCAAYLMRDGAPGAVMALALSGLFVAVDAWNGQARRPSILAALRRGAVGPPFALVCGAAAWAATDRVASFAGPPGRAYIAFSDPLWLFPISMLEALALWACYVALAALAGLPLLLFEDPDKEQIKIFG